MPLLFSVRPIISKSKVRRASILSAVFLADACCSFCISSICRFISFICSLNERRAPPIATDIVWLPSGGTAAVATLVGARFTDEVCDLGPDRVREEGAPNECPGAVFDDCRVLFGARLSSSLIRSSYTPVNRRSIMVH